MDEYEQYEQDCEAIRGQNEKILNEFSEWLNQKDFSESTVKKHVGNIEFYINDFLLNEDAIPAVEGADEVGEFLGYWFMRKASWATDASIRANAASLKNFYQFMFEKGEVDSESVDDLTETIKNDLPKWLAALEEYDDPSFIDIDKMCEYLF